MSTSLTQNLQKYTDNIASHFGFQEFNTLAHARNSTETTVKRKPAICSIPALKHQTNHLLTDGVRRYFKHELDTKQNATTYYTFDTTPEEIIIGLHTIGIQNAIAEALLLQTARSFLLGLGHTNQRVLINTIGDADSKRRFTRELEIFFRKNIALMPDIAAKSFSKDIIGTYTNLRELGYEVLEKSPRPIDHLNERSSRHLREILSYIDLSPATYDVNPYNLGDYTYASGPLFSIEVLDENNQPFPTQPCRITGGRYDPYTQKSFGRFTYGCSAVIVFDIQKKAEPIKDFTRKKHISIYLIEIGLIPKMRGITILDILLDANIYAEHSVGDYTLSAQLADAEASDAAYTLILGQHEVIHDEIIIRNMRDNSQVTVPIKNLVKSLYKLIHIS